MIGENPNFFHVAAEVEGIDRDSFEFTDDEFLNDYGNSVCDAGVDLARDKDDVYLFYLRDVYVLEGYDYESLEFISCYSNHGGPHIYTKDKNFVSFNGRRIEGADSESFDYAGGGFFGDKNHIYNYGGIVEGADAETFEIPEYR